jgi:hypothetical protein
LTTALVTRYLITTDWAFLIGLSGFRVVHSEFIP